MRARLPLSPGPMRAAGPGLGSRVGLFNLREDNKQLRVEPDGWMDGWILAMLVPVSLDGDGGHG